MRVIAGEFRSRRLKTVPGLEVRPTPDRLRESLFNILSPSIEGAVFVDAYAGCGAVGIEALSRGARKAVFIERSRAAAAVLRDNLVSLGLERKAEVIVGKAAAALARFASAIVFADPPYGLDGEYEATLRLLGESLPELAILQHHKRRTLPQRCGGIEKFRTVCQGENCLTFYRPAGRV